MDRERVMRQQQKESKRIEGVKVGDISEQTQEVMAQDLEDLIKQQGEDIDYEFFFDQKKILPGQTIFEIVKDNESKKRMTEKHAF